MDELEVVRRARPQVTPPSPRTLARIRADLDAAIEAERSARPRRRRYFPGAAAVVAVAVIVTVFGIGPDNGPTAVPPAGAVEIVPDGDYFEVRFLDLTANEDTIEATIRDAGLDIAVDLVPVSPSLVGTLVASVDDPADRDLITWVDPSDTGAPATVRVPTTYEGQLSLTIGRPAQSGESYTSAAVSAELPGELFHCGEITAGTAIDAADIASQRSVTVRWIDDTTHEQIGTQLPARYRDWYVIASTPIAANEVRLELAPTLPDDGRTPEFKAALQAGC